MLLYIQHLLVSGHMIRICCVIVLIVFIVLIVSDIC